MDSHWHKMWRGINVSGAGMGNSPVLGMALPVPFQKKWWQSKMVSQNLIHHSNLCVLSHSKIESSLNHRQWCIWHSCFPWWFCHCECWFTAASSRSRPPHPCCLNFAGEHLHQVESGVFSQMMQTAFHSVMSTLPWCPCKREWHDKTNGCGGKRLWVCWCLHQWRIVNHFFPSSQCLPSIGDAT